MSETGKHAAAGVDARTEAARSQRFQQLALPHLDAAYNLARWLCGNSNDADDVVQEAFMRAFRFFDTFHGDTARPWLLAIVRRTWYTEWRKRASALGGHGTVEFDENMDDAIFDGWSSSAAPDPEVLMIRDEDKRLVHAALEQLPVEFREVLILRELEELSYREIAEIADLPVGTVMSRLARGRRRLATALTSLQQTKGCARQVPNGQDGQGARDGGAVQRGPASRAAGQPDHGGSAAGETPRADSAAGNEAAGDGTAGQTRADGSAASHAGTVPRQTSGGWLPHAPGAVPGGIAQEAPDGL